MKVTEEYDGPIGIQGTAKKVIDKIKDLYDSPNWEQPRWNRSSARTWKKHRDKRYKYLKPSYRTIYKYYITE